MAEWTQRQIDAPDAPYLTAVELAKLLGFDGESTLYAMIKSGQLPRPLKRSGTSVWTWKDAVLANLLMEAWDRLEHPTEKAAAQKRPNPSESDQK